jgi:hypothetical protein
MMSPLFLLSLNASTVTTTTVVVVVVVVVTAVIAQSVFLFTTASRTALRPTQPPIKWVPGILSLGVKRPGIEADHSPPSRAEFKE